MKIVLVGGGTGGHFYPLIAVAESLQKIIKTERLVQPKIYYIAPKPFDSSILYENGVRFVYCTAGKRRLVNSFGDRIFNFMDLFKVFFGIIQAFFIMLKIYPDVVFSKGGYAAFPVLFIAKLFRIPVVIHDSDAIPGRVTKWSSGFARKIALSFAEAEKYFSEKKKKNIALTGVPIRMRFTEYPMQNASQKLDLDPDVPIVFILGGSSGSKYINDHILDSLPQLTEKYQIIHQTGTKLYQEVISVGNSLLKHSPHKTRYRPFPILNQYFMHAAYSAADLIIARSGGSAIFEIAQYGKPSILIPIPESISRDQKANAYAYARGGGALVIEQGNLNTGILLSQIETIIGDRDLTKEKKKRASQFARPAAAQTLAKELLKIVSAHV